MGRLSPYLLVGAILLTPGRSNGQPGMTEEKNGEATSPLQLHQTLELLIGRDGAPRRDGRDEMPGVQRPLGPPGRERGPAWGSQGNQGGDYAPARYAFRERGPTWGSQGNPGDGWMDLGFRRTRPRPAGGSQGNPRDYGFRERGPAREPQGSPGDRVPGEKGLTGYL